MRSRSFWLFGVVLVGACTGQAGTKVYVNRRCPDKDRLSIGEVDHSGYDALLRKYVDERGRVAYAAWKADHTDLRALDAYLDNLGCVDRSKPASKAARLAFWINAYNAVTLRGILREYPTKSIRKHTSRFGGYHIWKDLLLWVGGDAHSLDDIEHKVLRKMGEPRIHFAVVCASIGCPPLLNRAYQAEKLAEQLEANARKFFADANNFRADPRACKVWVSQLIEWYGTDFAPTPEAQVRVLRRYFPGDQSWMDRCRVTVEYLDYDWGLNDQPPRSP